MKTLTPRQARDLAAEPTTRLLDVRTPVEFEEMHIAGSKLIPLAELPQQCAELDPGERYLLICGSGKRAGQAEEILAENGFQDLSILDGGVMAWAQDQLPVTRTHRKGLPLMRQVQLVVGILALAGSVLAIASSPWFALIPAVLGAGLTMAGATGWCGLALLLTKMPWNRREGPCASG
mgnify:CR=1 FL=1